MPNREQGTSTNRELQRVWITPLCSGPIKSRQHLLNHVDMLFNTRPGAKPLSDVGLSRLALIMGESDESPFRCLERCDKEERLQRAREHVINHSHGALRWEQIAIVWQWDENEGIENGITTPLSSEEMYQLAITATDAWAELLGQTFEQFIEQSSVLALLPDWGELVLDRLVVDTAHSAADTEVASINVREAIGRIRGWSAAWKAFSKGVCHQETMREWLSASQEGRCPCCGKPLDDKPCAIHHIDYDHECTLVTLGKATKAACDYCKQVAPDSFAECASKLRLVHSSCNKGL